MTAELAQWYERSHMILDEYTYAKILEVHRTSEIVVAEEKDPEVD